MLEFSARGSLALSLVIGLIGTASGKADFTNGFERPLSAAICDAATPLSLGVAASGVIDPAGQRDYFRFSATPDQWLVVNTVANPDSNPDLFDSVLTLHSGDGEHYVAQNDDDLLLSFNLDSVFVYRSPAAASYCLQVEDYSTFSRETARGGPDFLYDLLVTPLTFGVSGNNRDAEPNNSSGAPQIVAASTAGGAQTAFLAGTFDAPADVDVFRLMTAGPSVALELAFTPHGTTGFGGTVGLGQVDILGSDGVSILARLNVPSGSRAIYLPVLGLTNYHVVVRSGGSALGANPFYFLALRTQTSQNPQENDDIGNGIPVTPEAAAPISVSDGRQYFLGGTFSAPDDVDWWSFQGNVGERLRLDCRSRRDGSGILNATFQVFRDPIQAPLQQETETEFADVRWSDLSGASRPAVALASTATYLLRIGAGAFDATVTDHHYRCGLHVATP